MEKQITGVMMYYYHVCKRKLWYFYHDIQMEHTNENVQIGKFIDEKTYQREDKHINIDQVINIDFIKSQGVLHEVKKSRKIEDASIAQVKYYLYYLEQRGVEGIKGRIDYPLLKQSMEVELQAKDRLEIGEILRNIISVVTQDLPPSMVKLKICKSCAFFDLCFI